MNERVKELRNFLDLTLQAFADKLGITKGALSNIEKGRNSVTEQMIKSICLAYNVNEEWLRTCKGDMFLETKESFLNDLAKQYSLDDFSIRIIEGFLELSPDKREVIKDYIKSLNYTDA